ncbi:MAG TPA: triose-phosphate isomerase family protein [Candidatus Babeliales bacterium]|nr:triose-phosphate isomerase family protein [Candidatus Babeliales bacterium]
MKRNAARIVVANWKMYLSCSEVKDRIEKNTEILQALSAFVDCKAVICPSAESLSLVHSVIQKSNVLLGAQTCAAFYSGAYTGQISARSLAEIGCSYCIIAHSEERARSHENDQLLQHKIEQAFANNLIPIFCIGETNEQFNAGSVQEVLEHQLGPVLAALQKIEGSKTIYIAYEPIWAIGTGKIPQADYIQTIFERLDAFFVSLSAQHTIGFLYGGSVDEGNASKFWKIALLRGLLVGKASTDFQTLKKIVLSSVE